SPSATAATGCSSSTSWRTAGAFAAPRAGPACGSRHSWTVVWAVGVECPLTGAEPGGTIVFPCRGPSPAAALRPTRPPGRSSPGPPTARDTPHGACDRTIATGGHDQDQVKELVRRRRDRDGPHDTDVSHRAGALRRRRPTTRAAHAIGVRDRRRRTGSEDR